MLTQIVTTFHAIDEWTRAVRSALAIMVWVALKDLSVD